MKKSVKAALLSTLIFPGTGHLYLKSFTTGLAILAVSLIALVVVISEALKRAAFIVSQMETSEMPMDNQSMAELLAQSQNHSVDTASAVIIVCWVAGIIDSYRIGARLDKQPMKADSKKP